ncbi:MAG: ketoacyl-ACP synthase III [Deltaproteobacteria bacterium]|nr:ketoacyl-ACP synthase III [Deltaproteobacteria bacterium]
MRRSRILGVGRYLPEKVVTNSDLEKVMDTTDEWIRQRTGIEQRRFVAEGEGAALLGVKASEEAIKRAGLKKEDIDLIIFATLSPDYNFPGSGVLVQDMLGIDTIGALDIRNQCTGFLYGLSVADQFIRTDTYRYVLVIGAEVHSTGIEFATRGRDVSVLFGDGAGAVVVGESEDEKRGILSVHLHSEGKYAKDLWVEAPGSIYHPRLTREMLEQGRHYPKMNGKNVFKHAVARMPEVIMEALDANGYTIPDIDLFVPHQANMRINEYVSNVLGIPSEKVVHNIQKYGNTTAATIPLCLYDALDDGRLKPGALICAAAFGAGFTWASALIRW